MTPTTLALARSLAQNNEKARREAQEKGKKKRRALPFSSRPLSLSRGETERRWPRWTPLLLLLRQPRLLRQQALLPLQLLPLVLHRCSLPLPLPLPPTPTPTPPPRPPSPSRPTPAPSWPRSGRRPRPSGRRGGTRRCVFERHWFFLHAPRSIGFFFPRSTGFSFLEKAPATALFIAFPKHQTIRLGELDVPLRKKGEKETRTRQNLTKKNSNLNQNFAFEKNSRSARRPTPRSTRRRTTLRCSTRSRPCGGACSPPTSTTFATGTTSVTAEKMAAAKGASPLRRRQLSETEAERTTEATAAAAAAAAAKRRRRRRGGRPPALPSHRSTSSSRPSPPSRAPRRPGRRPRRPPSTPWSVSPGRCRPAAARRRSSGPARRSRLGPPPGPPSPRRPG